MVGNKDRALNVWLDLVDQLLDSKMSLANAMYKAGEKLQEEQEKSRGQLFHPTDLYVATQDINILLRRTPEFTSRRAGWAKEAIDRNSVAY